MKKRTITALMVAPGEHPGVTTLCCCRQFLDLAVSIGATDPCDVTFMSLSKRAGILYNREAPLLGLRGNRKVGPCILAGVFYVVGVEKDRLASLPPDLEEYYTELFWEPENHTEDEVDRSFWNNWIDEIDRMLDGD